MKKSKLSMGLVTTFICGMSLVACNDVKANEKFVVTYKDYNDSEFGLLTDNMYKDYIDTDSGLTKYYDEVLNLLIRAKFEAITSDSTNGLSVKTSYDKLKSQAKNKVEEQKENARKNAKANKTSYSDEMETIYSSKGVEDEEGLYQSFLLELEKEQLTSAIFEDEKQLDILKNGNSANPNDAGWLKSARPYHIKHMLVKVEGGADEFTRGTITKDEATKLSAVVGRLVKGDSFDDVAANDFYNDDSSDKLGDVGIVNNNATSKSLKMVSEFQLGIYMVDRAQKGEDLEGLGFDAEIDTYASSDATVLDSMKNAFSAAEYSLDSLPKVPASVFATMGAVAELPKDTDNKFVREFKSCVYPRNILWNKYFNTHVPFLITNGESVNPLGDKNTVDGLDEFSLDQLGTAESGDATYTATTSGYNEDGYLCSEGGSIIFGVRSEYGIHFIKIEKSAYDEDVANWYPTSVKEAKDSNNYVTNLDNSKETQESRVSDIKDAIKSYDSNYEYRLYEFLRDYYVKNNFVDMDNENTKTVFEKINKHVEDLRASEKDKQKIGLKTVWEEYFQKVELLLSKRNVLMDMPVEYVDSNGDIKLDTEKRSALVPESVISDFLGAAGYTVDGDKLSSTNPDENYILKFLEGGENYYA